MVGLAACAQDGAHLVVELLDVLGFELVDPVKRHE
jgi:hypothetical protein